MRVLVINLPRAADRLEKIADRLARADVSFEVLVARDGLELTAAERARACKARRRWITEFPLTDNEIACWISHLRAMQALLDSSDPMLAVLEDDQIPALDLKWILSSIEHCQLDFDVIDLHRNFKAGEIFVPSLNLEANCWVGRIGYTHMNLCGYVISRAGAERFLSQNQHFVHAVDKALHRYWANGLRLYGLSRPAITQDATAQSYIDETRAMRRKFPKADRLSWKLARFLTRTLDSLQKRAFFLICIRAFDLVHRGRKRERRLHRDRRMTQSPKS